MVLHWHRNSFRNIRRFCLHNCAQLIILRFYVVDLVLSIYNIWFRKKVLFAFFCHVVSWVNRVVGAKTSHQRLWWKEAAVVLQLLRQSVTKAVNLLCGLWFLIVSRCYRSTDYVHRIDRSDSTSYNITYVLRGKRSVSYSRTTAFLSGRK